LFFQPGALHAWVLPNHCTVPYAALPQAIASSPAI
jgi:hypothetical protein